MKGFFKIACVRVTIICESTLCSLMHIQTHLFHRCFYWKCGASCYYMSHILARSKLIPILLSQLC